MEKLYDFIGDGEVLLSTRAGEFRQLYAPLCAPDGRGLKSSITPYLSGDIKIDKSHYLTRPSSREDLRSPVRNFFLDIQGFGLWSFADGSSPEKGALKVEIGHLWHRVTRAVAGRGLEVTAETFIPVSGGDVELNRFTVRNISSASVTLTPTAVCPLFARSLANKHDHEHVTALLNRTVQLSEGVVVEPTMMFNEEGHKLCHSVYSVLAAENGGYPSGTYPTVDNFLGDSGTWDRPGALVGGRRPGILSDAELQGHEAVGALQFASGVLAPGQQRSFVVALGIAGSREDALSAFTGFCTDEKFERALADNIAFWTGKTSAIVFNNGDRRFSSWMRWVTLQPVLRRIFGCSFLPDHDYGKGGKGWRDIWQDLLSLILIEPEMVREHLLNNFGGVRIDGSNATIIGTRPGEFIADRNAITRVWMDHGVWPLTTTQLYIDQTGDTALLFEQAPYFADPQMFRSLRKDSGWTPACGEQLRDRKGGIYRGTILEHILVQHLTQFFNVGEHNMIRLESADWNDGLDMAFKRGESVAFSAFYAGNLLAVAGLLEKLVRNGLRTVVLAREVLLLLDTLSSPLDYDNIPEKKRRLFEEYFPAVQPFVSGETVEIPAGELVRDLRRKGEWLKDLIRRQEMVSIDDRGDRFTWFNGYYDNEGARVEGTHDGKVRMTLTGQVFALMHGVVAGDEARAVVRAARHYLKDTDLGGYRLNTDFGVRHYLAMGRAFGFAFGTKENGAVFSHMAVMYGYALYRQGLAHDGAEVLRSLYDMSCCPGRAGIYPGVPEYFDASGRGMYHFLTGSASWYVLTLLTMVYGVRGDMGDLCLAPALVKNEFIDSQASVICPFAGRRLRVVYENPRRLDQGEYHIGRVSLNGREVQLERLGPATVRIGRKVLTDEGFSIEIRVELTR